MIPPSLNRLVTLSIAALSLCLAACQTATVESRINNHPTVFQGLSSRHQAEVAAGRIAEGMNKDAVFLAWGAPSARVQGGSDGKTKETWVYRRMQPVVRNNIGFGYGRGWGCRDHGHSFFHVSPSIQYIPRDAARVLFENQLVSSWQEQR